MQAAIASFVGSLCATATGSRAPSTVKPGRLSRYIASA